MNGDTRGIVKGEEYIMVRRDEVDPFIGQPRKKFKGIEELAASIKARGQQEPIHIKLNPPGSVYKYGLIAGERRHRACGIAGVKYMKAILKVVKDEKEQHLLSVIENENREGLTIMEKAHSIKRVKDDYGWSDEKIGREVYGKKNAAAWIGTLLLLLKLHPKVQEMVDEEEKGKRLPFAYAVEIARKIPSDQTEQLKIAKDIVFGKKKSFDAKTLIAKRSAELGVVFKERKRDPNEDYKILSGIPARTTAGLKFFSSKGQEAIGRIFQSRKFVDRENFIGELNELIAEATKLKNMVANA